MEKKIILKSLLNAFLAVVYISGVAWLMFNGENFFGQEDNFLIPVFMLLLFIISALITGSLVLGRPIQLYLDGAKKEALLSLVATLCWLILFLLIIVIVLIIL